MGSLGQVWQAEATVCVMKRLPALIMLMWAAFLITVLDLYALSQGIDGTLLIATVGALSALAAGFAGFRIGRR